MTLKLAIPSKGRLQDETLGVLAEAGLLIERTGSGREYAAEARGIAGVEPVLLSAGEIPRELAAGRIHLGVTGEDLVRERIPDWPRATCAVKPLGFGRADLIVAVPTVWIDVETMHDLDAAAARFRQAHGRRMRIATKYHRLAREWFARWGVADYALVDSQGATEGGPKYLTAEAIVDITTSGETLRANHLRPLEDGPILKSEATLFASRAADWSPEAQRACAALAAGLGAPAPDLG